MIQPFFDDDEDMEMPCVCDCGRVFDLHDGVAHPTKNITVCWKCGEKANRKYELEQQIESCEYDIECEVISKRDGKKRLKQLKAELDKIDSQPSIHPSVNKTK